jgi:hypothetical protein
MSPDHRIQAPVDAPGIDRHFEGLAGLCCFQQSIPQPSSVAALEIKGLAEYPGLVASPRMGGVEAIIL